MDENKKDDNVKIYAIIVNAIFQTISIMVYQYFGIFWPLQIIMVLLSILIVAQTISAAGLISGISDQKPKINSAESLSIMIGFIYLLSVYNIYQAGYVVFAIVSFTHIAIYILTAAFSWLRVE